MKKSVTKKAVAATIPQDVVFPLSGDYKLRILCRRGECKGVLELTPAELMGYEGPAPNVDRRFGAFGGPAGVILCPSCGGEFSSGMKGSFSGDKCRLVGTVFQGLTNRTWCNTFAVELVRKG